MTKEKIGKSRTFGIPELPADRTKVLSTFSRKVGVDCQSHEKVRINFCILRKIETIRYLPLSGNRAKGKISKAASSNEGSGN